MNPGPGGLEEEAGPGKRPLEPTARVLEARWERRLVEVLGTLEKRLVELEMDEPGTVRVQVVGKGAGDERLSLPGLTVRLMGKQRVETRTEGSGVAVPRPREREETYRAGGPGR
jgi:hypothetical protein